MAKAKRGLSAGRKELQEIIKTADAISERKFNPFFLDVNLGVDTLRKYFPAWETFDDHCLDAHTLNKLSEVVRLQNTQLKFQSSALYADPNFVLSKIKRMSEKRLAEVFLQSWHPLTELERMTEEAFTNGLAYWNILAPFAERRQRREAMRGKPPSSVNAEVLTGLGIHGEEFSKQVTRLWENLRQAYSTKNAPVDYWEFIKGGSYQDKVNHAYLVSFLVTYGYAKLHADNDQLLLTPVDQPSGKAVEGGVSLPIPIPAQEAT